MCAHNFTSNSSSLKSLSTPFNAKCSQQHAPNQPVLWRFASPATAASQRRQPAQQQEQARTRTWVGTPVESEQARGVWELCSSGTVPRPRAVRKPYTSLPRACTQFHDLSISTRCRDFPLAGEHTGLRREQRFGSCHDANELLKTTTLRIFGAHQMAL